MISFSVQTSETREWLRHAFSSMVSETGHALEDGLERGEGIARQNLSLKTKTRTGMLMQGVRGELVSFTHGRLVDRVPYAGCIEFGTRPHVIEARRAKFLRFINRSGKVVFARKVNHPGTKPRSFMREGADAAAQLTSNRIEERFSDIILR